MTNDLLSGKGTVRVTMNGLYGDSGLGPPVAFLAAQGPAWDLLRSSESHYEMAKRSREIVRSSCQPTITNLPWCVFASVTYDNSVSLPPFLPAGRNSDGVFGTTLKIVEPQAYFAHIPQVVLHDPPENRRAGEDDVWQAAAWVRIAEAVTLFMESAELPAGEVGARLEGLGRHMNEAASKPDSQFQRSLRDLLAMKWQRMMEFYIALLDTRRDGPEYWRADVIRAIAHLRGALEAKTWFGPGDLSGNPTAQLRQIVELYSGLLLHWKDITRESKTWADTEFELVDGMPWNTKLHGIE